MKISDPRMLLALRILATIGSAVTLACLIRPLQLHWLHWVAYLPMIWALREDSPRSNRWLAFLYGTVAVFAIFRWIAETIILFSNIPGAAAFAILGLFSVAFGLPYFFLWTTLHPLRRRLGSWWIVAFPAVLVLIEYASMFVLLFPYNQAVSQYETPFTWQLVSVTGVWGLSFLLLFFNCAFGEAIYRYREGKRFPVYWAATAVSCVSLVICWGVWRTHKVEEALQAGDTLRIGQIQLGAPMTERLQNVACVSFYEWVEATRQIPRNSVDIVVWAEGSIPYALNESLRFKPRRHSSAPCAQPQDPARMLSELAKRGNFDLLVGAGAREFTSPFIEFSNQAKQSGFKKEDGNGDALAYAKHVLVQRDDFDTEAIAMGQVVVEFTEKAAGAGYKTKEGSGDALAYAKHALTSDANLESAQLFVEQMRAFNSTFYFKADGTILPRYDKMVPLPFGEYLPLSNIFPIIRTWIEGPGNFQAGTVPVIFEGSKSRVAAPICYEATFPSLCRAFAEPDLFINITNDAWFGDTAAPHQHAMLAATRSAELGIPLYRSAYTGISMAVEPHGRIAVETQPFTDHLRIVTIRTAKIDTFYRTMNRYGLADWFVYLCGLGLILALIIGPWTQKGRGT